MRIIPKRTRLRSNIWLNFTLLDIALIGIMFVVLGLIIMSNLPNKWIIALAYTALCIVLMLGDGDQRTYVDLGVIMKYAVSKKKFRTQKEIDSLIPFNNISEDGIIDYGTYYGKVISVGSMEFGLLSEYQQDSMIASLGRVLASVGPSTTLQLVKIDRPINYDEIAYLLNEKINQEESNSQSQADVARVEILSTRLEQIDELNNLQPQYRPFYYIVVYENTKENLLAQVQAISDALQQMEIECNYLDDTQTAVFLKYCFSRNFDERDVWDYEGSIRDYVKPKSIKFSSTAVEVDNTYSFTYAISDYPLTVGNAWGAKLFNIDNTKVVLTLKAVDKSKSIKRIDGTVVELASRQGGKASEYIDRDTHFETMRSLLVSLKNEDEQLFDCNLTITGFNNTKKGNSEFRKEIRRQIQAEGFRVNALIGRQFDGYVTSAISRRTALKRFERGINSQTLAAIFPFVFSSVIDINGITLGHNDYPVIIDFWKRDDYHNNSNVCILGKSGAGKSYMLKSLLTNLYSDRASIFVLDPENEYNELCHSLQGKMIDVGNASLGRINPLHIYPILTDDGEVASPETTYSAQLRFLENFFRMTLQGISTDSLEELNNVIVKLYAEYGINQTTDCSTFSPKQFPSFDGLLDLVKRELANERLPSRIANLTRIQTYVEKFAESGRYAQLWNGPSTLEADESFVVFNFQSLFESKNTVASNAQMLVVYRWLEQKIINIREQNRNGANIHPAIIADEAHMFVDPKYPIALDFMYLQAKRIRKYNGMFCFATQNLADLMGNEDTKQKTTALFNNCQYAFFFALSPIDVASLKDIYAVSGGLNETEANAIAQAKRGDAFAVLSARERTIFHISTHENLVKYFDASSIVQVDENQLQTAENAE